MKATEFVSEIERLPKAGYVGGKSTLKQNPEYVKQTQLPTAKPLPGGSGLLYGIDARNYQTVVRIYDPEANWLPIGALKLDNIEKGQWPFQPAYQVNTITTDEDYQGQSIAKSLYGIVLTIMQATLLAGTQQTPGGRALWVKLTNQIPGVEVTGYLTVSDLDLEVDTSGIPKNLPDFAKMEKALARNAQKTINSIQSLGAQYIGEIDDIGRGSGGRRVYQFPVTVDITARGEEVANADKASKIAIYNNFIPRYNRDGELTVKRPWETGLMARWLG
jgi:ribosomal protein S18 acetylase RimI-like enzyme